MSHRANVNLMLETIKFLVGSLAIIFDVAKIFDVNIKYISHFCFPNSSVWADPYRLPNILKYSYLMQRSPEYSMYQNIQLYLNENWGWKTLPTLLFLSLYV